MPIHWSDGTNAIAATASALAAIAAWIAARRSNATAETVAQIERDRWHAELTPEFEVTATEFGHGSNKVTLRIVLTKPTGLPGLTRSVLRIRDDGYNHQPGGLVTQEMIDTTIFGPYRFEPCISGASADGRTVTGRPVGLGDWDKFTLERTMPDHADPETWMDTYIDAPIRLSIECHADGHKPWYITYEVPVAGTR